MRAAFARRENLQRLSRERARAVKRERLRLENKRVPDSFCRYDGSQRADRRNAAALQSSKKGAFRRYGEISRFMEQSGDLLARFRVVLARFQTKRALSDGGQKIGSFQILSRALVEFQTRQTGLARITASYSPSSSLRKRVSTLPRALLISQGASPGQSFAQSRSAML